MSGIFQGLNAKEKEELLQLVRSCRWAVYLGTMPSGKDDDEGNPRPPLQVFKMWGQTFTAFVPTLIAPVCDPPKAPVEMAEKFAALGGFKTFVSEQEAKKWIAENKKIPGRIIDERKMKAQEAAYKRPENGKTSETKTSAIAEAMAAELITG
jgi:hypothetical protein